MSDPAVSAGAVQPSSPPENTQGISAESVAPKPQNEVKHEVSTIPSSDQNVEAIKQESVQPNSDTVAPVAVIPTPAIPAPAPIEPTVQPESTAPATLATETVAAEPEVIPEAVVPAVASLPVEVQPNAAAPVVSETVAPQAVPETAKGAVASEVVPENPEAVNVDTPNNVESKSEAPQAGGDNKLQNNTPPKEINWQQRELELLKKIDELEKVKSVRSEDSLKLELKVREEEIDLLKARVRNLETELQAAMSKPSGKNHEMIENIKQQHEELLSKARGMIFDKTKMVKNQELQIEALTTQVQSLKDINLITKDLLEIRNSEVKAMEERLQAMEARFKTEKERYGLVLQRAQTSSTINDDLRKEYETQLAIFKELREKYELRVQALVAENAKLKESKGDTSGTSTSG